MYTTRFSRTTLHSHRPDQNRVTVRIVCATTKSLAEFKSTMLGTTLDYHSQLFDFELFVQDLNDKPLGEIYNHVIEFSRDNAAILLFVHDDVIIADFWWPQRLHKALQNFDIVGVVGTTKRIPNQCSWVFTSVPGEWHDQRYFSGSIGIGWPLEIIHAYGPTSQRCQLLDGVFLAVHSGTLITSGLRFDPRFDFHFYDLDFCRQAEILGLSMGTTDVSVIHRSGGTFNDNYYVQYKKYLDKWQQ